MGHPVTVLSPDNIRGSILKKILAQSGFNVLWGKSYYEAEEALDKKGAGVIIFDAKGPFFKEVGLVEKIRRHLPGIGIIVLTEANNIPIFAAQGFPRELCLPEPMDPELIVAKVQAIVLAPQEQKVAERGADRDTLKESGRDTLTNFLKQFLKLE